MGDRGIIRTAYAKMKEIDDGHDAIDVVNLCSELVLLPSVTDGEHELSPLIYLEKLFQKYQVSYEVITGSEKKKSIVATIGSGEPSVMLNSHFDVVPVPFPSLFHPHIEGGRLYGRGSADAKGPLSAMITSFLSFRDEGIKGKIVLCAVCDEENAGTFGTKVVAERGIRATYNIFGEPTDFEVIIAEKGFLRLSISCTGKEAHAAFPDNGINAIRLASNIIQDIDEMSWNVPHQLLSPPTISYGTIDGGSKINVVAGKCKLTIDMRYLPGQDETELVEMFSQLAQRQGDCVVEVISSGPPMETSVDSPLVTVAAQVTKRVPRGVNFATDARFFQGNDCIVLGPGKPELAHQEEEYVEISDLEKAVVVYRTMIQKLIGI